MGPLVRGKDGTCRQMVRYVRGLTRLISVNVVKSQTIQIVQESIRGKQFLGFQQYRLEI